MAAAGRYFGFLQVAPGGLAVLLPANVAAIRGYRNFGRVRGGGANDGGRKHCSLVGFLLISSLDRPASGQTDVLGVLYLQQIDRFMMKERSK